MTGNFRSSTAFVGFLSLTIAQFAWALSPIETIEPNPESCNAANFSTGYFTAPPALLDRSTPPEAGILDQFYAVGCGEDRHCGRLHPTLRIAARLRDARKILQLAAAYYYLADAPDSDFGAAASTKVVRSRYSLTMAQAIADLAATGRTAYASLGTVNFGSELNTMIWQSRSDIAARLTNIYTELGLSGNPPAPDFTRVTLAVVKANQRAQSVAWALRGPTLYRTSNRAALGWIAVSGEDDPPHRPVNVPSAPYPQFNIQIDIPPLPFFWSGTTVDIRYVIMGQKLPEQAGPGRPTIPPDSPPPTISGDIILFLHGNSSRAEEALAIVEEMHRQASARGRSVTIIAPDLPFFGYSSRGRPGDLTESTRTHFPGLQFLEVAVASFVGALERQQPGISKRIIGTIGGSLGGNLVLRLSQHSRGNAWLNKIVSWSPASVWDPFASACDAGWPQEYILMCVPVRLLEGSLRESETERSRGEFFSKQLLAIDLLGSGTMDYADRWYAPDWSCRDQAIQGAERFNQEVYHPSYRLWNRRLQYEQLNASHNLARTDGSGLPQYTLTKPTLFLLAGGFDNFSPEQLFKYANDMASNMDYLAGRALFIKNAGHSIHAERPTLLVSRMLDFLLQ